MAVKDGKTMEWVVEQLKTTAYEDLVKSELNGLQKKKIDISDFSRFSGLKSWNGKSTADLIENVYIKINDIRQMYTGLGDGSNRKFKVRIKNLDIKHDFLKKHLAG
jgi:hypothetical protein